MDWGLKLRKHGRTGRNALRLKSAGAVLPEAAHPSHASLTLWLGVSFILLGAIAAGYSARQYSIVLRAVRSTEFPPGYVPWLGLSVNGIVAALGACLIVVLMIGRL